MIKDLSHVVEHFLCAIAHIACGPSLKTVLLQRIKRTHHSMLIWQHLSPIGWKMELMIECKHHKASPSMHCHCYEADQSMTKCVRLALFCRFTQ